jgi:hypothetical protein
MVVFTERNDLATCVGSPAHDTEPGPCCFQRCCLLKSKTHSEIPFRPFVGACPPLSRGCIARRLDDPIPNLAFCSSLFSTRQSAVQNDSKEEAVNSLRAEIGGLPITAHVDGQSLA